MDQSQSVHEPAPAEGTAPPPAADPRLPTGPVLVSVCITCRAKGAPVESSPGPGLRRELAAALEARGGSVLVRPVQCLSVCQRPVSVAVSAPGGFTFIFGDLAGAADAAALATFAGDYATAAYGFVPWKARPAALRAKIVARLPPPAWSPEDGRQPG